VMCLTRVLFHRNCMKKVMITTNSKNTKRL